MASGRNLKLLSETISKAEKEALDWFALNELPCNLDKTQNILLSLSQCSVKSSAKLLGFVLDSKLNWADHITIVFLEKLIESPFFFGN
jgi:hypothetical protein